jgi:hypothetical protein
MTPGLCHIPLLPSPGKSALKAPMAERAEPQLQSMIGALLGFGVDAGQLTTSLFAE